MRSVALLTALLVTFLPMQMAAQTSPFSAAITVNEQAITYYEIRQRKHLLGALGGLGNLDKQARDQLIDERLQQIAAKRASMEVAEDSVREAMERFAQSADLTLPAFLRKLKQQGVDEETIRDYVRARVTWQGLIRGLFINKARVTESEVDRAMALAQGGSGVSALLSEIILPMPPELAESNAALAKELVRTIHGQQEFADAARTFSASPSADNGGNMGWLALGRLPQQIASMLISMEPGDITEPIEITNALAIFQMRGLREDDASNEHTVSVEYLRVMLPGEGGAEQAKKLEDELDACDDFYGHSKKIAPESVTREVLPVADIPEDIGLELARLDTNEVSVSQGRDGNVMFLMLCGRTSELGGGNRDEVQAALFTERLSSYADSYLEELRADAIIVEQ